MQANPVDVMASDQLGGGWNTFPYGFSDYSVPSGDWITSLQTELDNVPTVGGDTESQPKEPPILSGGIHRISPLDSPIEPSDPNGAAEPKYPLATGPYHLHQPPTNYGASCYQHQQKPIQQFAMKHAAPNNARFVPHGYYANHGGRMPAAAGPTMPQTDLYPSPPVQSLSPEDANYGKPYGLLYMHGDHVPPPITFTGHTDPTLPALSGGPLANDLYQPYQQPPPSVYDGNGSPYSNVGIPSMEPGLSTIKYDVWHTDSNGMMSPMGHPAYPSHGHHAAFAIKQEYHSPAYISPSPSSMAGSSSVKTELLSDTSQSPPLTVGHTHGNRHTIISQSPLPHQVPGPLPPPKNETNPSIVSPAVRKPARNSNNYGSQFVCPECSRTFARQCGLTQHMKWHHSGEKPFRCLICGKCFAAQQALDDHIERHMTTDKPYRCKECTKAFFHKNDLRRHAYQHSGLAPHACRYCTKTFARKDHCHSHEFSHERKLQRKERKVKGRQRQSNTANQEAVAGAIGPSQITGGNVPDFIEQRSLA